MSIKKQTSAEQFVFSGVVPDLELKASPSDEQSIRTELFGAKFDPEKMIDAYETQMGIQPPSATAQDKMLMKHIMLSPGSDSEDDGLLFQLLNDKELYPNMKETHYWTPKGEYKMFIIYSENQSVKEKRALASALQPETTND